MRHPLLGLAAVFLSFILMSGFAQAVPNVSEVQKVMKAGNFQQAESMLKEVVQAKPTSTKALYLMAQTRIRLKDFAGAKEALDKAKKLDSTLSFAGSSTKFYEIEAAILRGLNKSAAPPKQKEGEDIAKPRVVTAPVVSKPEFNSVPPTKPFEKPVQKNSSPLEDSAESLRIWTWLLGLALLAIATASVIQYSAKRKEDRESRADAIKKQQALIEANKLLEEADLIVQMASDVPVEYQNELRRAKDALIVDLELLKDDYGINVSWGDIKAIETKAKALRAAADDPSTYRRIESTKKISSFNQSVSRHEKTGADSTTHVPIADHVADDAPVLDDAHARASVKTQPQVQESPTVIVHEPSLSAGDIMQAVLISDMLSNHDRGAPRERIVYVDRNDAEPKPVVHHASVAETLAHEEEEALPELDFGPRSDYEFEREEPPALDFGSIDTDEADEFPELDFGPEEDQEEPDEPKEEYYGAEDDGGWGSEPETEMSLSDDD